MFSLVCAHTFEHDLFHKYPLATCVTCTVSFASAASMDPQTTTEAFELPPSAGLRSIVSLES